MARSTGITCMPMPSPPGGTMWVMGASGSKVMRSNMLATAGFLSMRSMEELKSSAEPGTKYGMRQRLVRGSSVGPLSS